jgi:hypothetical protein
MQRRLPPHQEANVLDAFVTSYDIDYKVRSNSAHGFGRSGGDSSGYTSNRPVFCVPRRQDGALSTTNGALLTAPHRSIDAATAATSLTVPGDGQTAQSRERTTVGVGCADPTPLSTMKASYNFGQGSLAKGEPHGESSTYAGNSTTQFTRNFLHINAFDNPSQQKQRDPPATAPVSLLASRRSQLHIGSSPRNYFLHSRLIGDRSLALPSQLPTRLKDATNAHLVGTSCDRRSLVDKLSGSRTPPPSPPLQAHQTNPIPMRRDQKEKCRVAKRLECEGHATGSMYRSYFVNQRNLPEFPDPVTLKTVSSVAIAANVITGNAQTPDCPQGVHPAVWRQRNAAQRARSIELSNPHQHKLRVPRDLSFP